MGHQKVGCGGVSEGGECDRARGVPCSGGWGSVRAVSCRLGVACLVPQVGRHRAAWRHGRVAAVAGRWRRGCYGEGDGGGMERVAAVAWRGQRQWHVEGSGGGT